MKKIAVAAGVTLTCFLVGFAVSPGTEKLGGVPVVVWQIAAAFGIQWAVYVHSLVFRTERFFDLTGSLTYIGVTLFGILAAEHRSPTGWLLTGLVVLWAARLGAFLFRRILRAGKDDRFEQILRDPSRLFLTWTLQGVWVSLTALAAWTGIQSAGPEIHWLTWLGALVWLAGFAFEVIADRQKSAFRARPENRDDFIRTGLWAWSRHPNYAGEILLWSGVFLAAAPSFAGWQWLTVISPLFVVLLLMRVSGIPLLEKKADERWGDRPEYQQYASSTPVLIPRPPRRRQDPAGDL